MHGGMYRYSNASSKVYRTDIKQRKTVVVAWESEDGSPDRTTGSCMVGKLCLRTVLTRKLGPKRDEVTGGWRKLHNNELHKLYSSPSIIRMIKSRRMSWAGHVARVGALRNAYRILVGKPEGKRPLGRPRRR
jgi:hypothetical protein